MNVTSVAWQGEANCAGKPTNLFFPVIGVGKRYSYKKNYSKARNICLDCTVSAECYDFAISNSEEYGMWGGVNFTGRSKHGKRARDKRLIDDRNNFITEQKEKQNA